MEKLIKKGVAILLAFTLVLGNWGGGAFSLSAYADTLESEEYATEDLPVAEEYMEASNLSLSDEEIDFGSSPENYSEAPAAASVTISNSGSDPITLAAISHSEYELSY